MPGRELVLSNDYVYHLLNRGNLSQFIFNTKVDYRRALQSIFYYQNSELPSRYSYFIAQSLEFRSKILKELKIKRNFLIEIIAYCLMPTHFHLIVKQIVDNGISQFMSNFANSYTRYFNTKNQIKGHLFQGRFKAVKIDSDDQLCHLSRYVHLNPYSSGIVKDIQGLKDYPYSSFPEYINSTKDVYCQKELVLSQFKRIKDYKEFVFDRADYQKELEYIKRVALEN